MKKIGFIGAGNMAGALIRGLLASQRYKPADIWVSDPQDAQVRRLKRAHKVEGTRDNRLLVRQSQTVILAVKPQAMAQLLDEIRPEANPKKLFVSIAAGFQLRRLETGLGGQARVVRVMPNTPVLVGKGISVAVAGSKATPTDPVAVLQGKLDRGEVKLAYDNRHGYLPAVLDYFGIPRSSQTLVYSKTSLQRSLITPETPRALYFNDDVYVGYIPGSPVLEVSAVDPKFGGMFYHFDQEKVRRPVFVRDAEARAWINARRAELMSAGEASHDVG